MKKQHYYLLAAGLFVAAIAAGVFFWKNRQAGGEKAETPVVQEVMAPQIVLRELQKPKADEEKFFEAVRRQAGTTYDSLSRDQKLASLLKLADDEETTNRLLATRMLGDFETAQASREQKLVAKLKDESSWVVEEAVLALMKLRSPAAAAPLRELYFSLQTQQRVEYVPFRDTAYLTAHGRVAPANAGTEFNLQFTPYPKSGQTPLVNLNGREKLALFVPAEFEMCLFAPNFKTHWETLQNSAFVKQLLTLQAWQDFKAAEPYQQVFALWEQLDKQLGLLGGNFNYFIDPLGDEVCVASYPMQKEDRFLLVTPANLKAKAVTNVLAALGKFESGDLTVTKQIYRKQTMFDISSQRRGSMFRYAVVDGFLVLSNNQQLLARAISSYLDSDENSLAYQPALQQSLPQVEPASFLLAYVDPEKYFDITRNEHDAASLAGTVANALQEITGETITVSQEASPDSLPAPAIPPVEDQTLRFIPADAVFCYATTAIEPAKFWQYVTTMRAEREAIKGFETRSNLNLERDLVRKLDRQMLYFFAGIDTTGPRFFWRQLAGVRLREPAGMEAYVKRLMTYFYSPKEEMQVEEYNGGRIHYIKSPTSFEPNFAIVDGYLLTAFDRATLRAAIDAGRQRAEAIAQNPRFEALRTRLSTAENAVAYFNAESFFENYRSYLMAYDRQTHLFDEADLQLRIDPLFALFKATAQTGAGKFSAKGNGEMVLSMK